MDPVPAKKVFGAFRQIYEWLENRQGLNQFEYLGEEILVAMDGSEYFSSDKIHCPHCSKRQHKNGKVTYFHQVITPVIVSPDCKKVINLEPEFVRILYQNRFITNHEINESNVSKIAKGGRTRWKVENEGFNLLKKHGYHLEHNFGHGQQNLGEILLSLNLLAFLFHNLLDLVDTTYQKVRSLLGTRRTFFNDLRALLKYFWFANWSDLWEFILTEDDDLLAVNSS